MRKLSPSRQKLHEEASAVAMLTKELLVRCSGCLGEGASKGLFGPRRCIQCGGYGYEVMGPSVERYIKGEFNE